ncbi:hypothetical protein P7K49_034277, partial [Saguinus oedipus]
NGSEPSPSCISPERKSTEESLGCTVPQPPAAEHLQASGHECPLPRSELLLLTLLKKTAPLRGR